MYSRGFSFVIVLIALALVGGAVATSQLTTHNQQLTTGETGSTGSLQKASIFSWWKKTPAAVTQNQESSTQILADIERQLTTASKSGGISPTSYKDIDTKLKTLESKGVNTKNARATLARLSVGGREAKATPPKSNSVAQTLADVEQEIKGMLQFKGINPSVYAEFDTKLKAFEAKGANTKNARAMLKKIPVGGQETSAQKKSENGPVVDKERIASEPVVWVYHHDQNKWVPSKTPPPCPALVFDSPVDLTKAYAILYPGQTRGNSIKDYKAHGGVMFKSDNTIDVRMPFDGYIYQGARFLQKGVLQYGFDAISECGIMQRFGHLYELSPKFQKLVELLPEPKEMDSRTTVLRPFVYVKKGELIATKIGVPENAGMDWGVMDLRRENEAAKDAAFREAHSFQRWYDNHGLCWLDYLSEKEQAIVKALPGGDGRMGKTSDYCGRPISASPVSANISEEARHVATGSNMEPPLLLKSIGVDLGYFDAVTGKAGDFVFTKGKLQFGVLFTEFGFTIPANQSATGADKRNPQPTFLLPLGTKVRSLVDGVVVAIPKLYSNDYSIHVAPSQDTNWRYETEHVINPLVKVGDTVKAGQVIAEVSPHDSANSSGYGLVEIGILRGGNPPEHICPFAYLDPSIKDDVQKKLSAFYKSWEEYRGDSALHNEAAQTVIGCLSLDPIPG